MCLLINIINFVFLSLVKLGYFGPCLGGWVGEIKNNDQLCPPEAETRAELGNRRVSLMTLYVVVIAVAEGNIWKNVIGFITRL